MVCTLNNDAEHLLELGAGECWRQSVPMIAKAD